MQRAGTHKVLGRGRLSVVQVQVCLARVLNRQRAVADGCRWAALRVAIPGVLKLGVEGYASLSTEERCIASRAA
jgi:hypothetical protein